MRCYIVPWIGGGKSYFTEDELPHVVGSYRATLLTRTFPVRYSVGRSECDHYYISTSFLGYCHNGCGPPTPFETMVFRQENGEVDYGMELAVRRASTWENAEHDHRELAEMYLTKLPDDWPKLKWERMD